MDGVKKFLDRFPVMAFGRAAAAAAGAINCVFGTRRGNGFGA